MRIQAYRVSLGLFALMLLGCSETNSSENNVNVPDILRGIAVIGDSFYDEYRGSDDRGGDYASSTFNLVELLAMKRGLNFGRWGDWGEPRRTGFEYNWARSGDTSDDMIRHGQHMGAAQQVREGSVTFVYIGIGANDFSPYYGDSYRNIYSGTTTDAGLRLKVEKAIGNVTLAVDTVKIAGAKGIAVTLFTQWELDPVIQYEFPDASRRKRVADAIDAVNSGILAMAHSRKIAVVDQNSFGRNAILPFLVRGFLIVGGEKIDFLHNGDEPHHSRLADNQHIGTVVSGIVANYYFVDAINSFYGTHIARLATDEILAAAQLHPDQRTE
jgi:hypothetical protein